MEPVWLVPSSLFFCFVERMAGFESVAFVLGGGAPLVGLRPCVASPRFACGLLLFACARGDACICLLASLASVGVLCAFCQRAVL